MTDGGIVHLIDDEETVLMTLAYAVASAGYAARTYQTAEEFLDVMPQLGDDCVVSDICMPRLDGIELLRRIKASRARAPVILMSGQANVAMAVEAMKAGAGGVLEKPFRPAVLLNAIAEALRPLRLAAEGGTPTGARPHIEGLTPRQRQVLRGVVAGKRNKTIAYELGISTRTVETYRAQIMARSRTSTMGELIRAAMAAGY